MSGGGGVVEGTILISNNNSDPASLRVVVQQEQRWEEEEEKEEASKENEIGNYRGLSGLFPPPRTPLNTIQDPSQWGPHAHHNEADADSLNNTNNSKKKRASSSNINSNSIGKGRSAERDPSTSTPLKPASRPHFTSTRCYSSPFLLCNNNNKPKHSDFLARQVLPLPPPPHFDLNEDPSFWSDHNVQVLIRIRPLNPFELERHSHSHSQARCLKQENPHSLVWFANGHPDLHFTFDHVACETISQEKLFRVAGFPIVDNCISGYNSCMFAYGQTGSGKTYTMLGEINQVDVDGNLGEQCGITPRIFDYLFSRIRMEEEKRRKENLKFRCKCSFLEIYNEQITDLLDPSSTNLQIREDLNKGVYVENLTEHPVRTVNDVIRLLLQGAANRKIAATYMNCESSRSHSVFTCIIESQWEKDSLTHFRFARLNLVDLAGSERQKSLGAEGDRLKEAANINKSLSTLGLVIMSLVDLAHGKHRHVPYRDSRLTFLLQDSLGGNSKTTIIANVSPSICSAHETLSTLKFAQRAKLIQNNAKVNEDASGDVHALQRQIQQLKYQMSVLLRHHSPSNPLSICLPDIKEPTFADYFHTVTTAEEKRQFENTKNQIMEQKMKHMEAMLTGALRREKMAEALLRKLGAEIEKVKQFAFQREEDVQHTKMMLCLQEEKIKQLELLLDGSIPADQYLRKENKALKEEIQLLQVRMEENSDLKSCSLEYRGPIEQLQMFQISYEQGERTTWLTEVSKLHDQSKDSSLWAPRLQDNATMKELEDCKNMNSKLMSEVDELQMKLRRFLNCSSTAFDVASDSCFVGAKEVRYTDKYSMVETASLRSDSSNEMDTYSNDMVIPCINVQPRNRQTEMTNAGRFTESMEGQSFLHLGSNYLAFPKPEKHNKGLMIKGNKSTKSPDLEAKLDKVNKDLQEARVLNCRYKQDWVSQSTHKCRVESVCEQLEMETSRTILHFQDEATALQSELDEKLHCMTEENIRLKNIIADKEEENKRLSNEWEMATIELTRFLLEGSKSFQDVCSQIETIASSFPLANVQLSEQVEKVARACIDKEELILQLEKSLEDAQKMVVEMEIKLNSLKETIIALNKFPQPDDEGTDEAVNLHMLSEKIDMVKKFENKLKLKEDHIKEAEKRTDAALLVAKWLSNGHNVSLYHCIDGGMKDSNLVSPSEIGKGKAPQIKVGDLGSPKLLTSENQLEMSQNLRDELLRMSDRLRVIADLVDRRIRFSGSPLPDDNSSTGADCWNTDNSTSGYSTSDSNDSTESVTLPNKSDGFTIKCISRFAGKTAEQFADLKLQNVSMVNRVEHSEFISNELHHDKSVILWLKEALDVAFDAFKELYACLNASLDGNSTMYGSTPKGMKELVPYIGSRIIEKEVGDSFCENIKEETNENARQSNGMWKQASEELTLERSSLIGENEQLKSSQFLKDEENRFLLTEICHCLREVAHSTAMLEGCFSQIQRELDDWYNTLYSDLSSVGREMLRFIRDARSSLEDMSFNTMEKGFFEWVMYQCLAGKIFHKISSFNDDLCPFRKHDTNIVLDSSQMKGLNGQEDIIITNKESREEGEQEVVQNSEEDVNISQNELKCENLSLKKQLQRNEAVLKGLLFDFRLLQETTSSRKDARDETSKLIVALSEVRQELEMKSSHLNDLLVQHKELEGHLMDVENALFVSNSELDHANKQIEILADENASIRMLAKDLYLRKSEVESYLDEQKRVVKCLEEEVIHLTSSMDGKARSSVDGLGEELRKVTQEKDRLHEEIRSLNDKIEVAYALADQNEAMAIEARQESEASKSHADRKEEEVKILENSVEELECTIDVLEKKVHEMEDEVERHRLIRDSLELELQVLRQRLSKVEQFTYVHCGEPNHVRTEDPLLRQIHRRLIELHEANNQKRVLEKTINEKDEEIKQCKEYISELVLHSDAQSSQFQEKYKTLEAMVHGVKDNLEHLASAAPTSDRSEKSAVRTRGSSSPFRCIASLMQQINVEKDQELYTTRLRVEDLEAALASRQQEVCTLNARLAAAESMTHDVIRDLLGVKLDMTKFANLIDQHQIQKLVEDYHQQTEETQAKEQEISKLRTQIDDLIEEKERCISELNKKVAVILSVQMTVEQLQQRDQLLSTENEMLKKDKSNLLRRLAELDEMVKTIPGGPNTEKRMSS